jgi:hypothetical protein
MTTRAAFRAIMVERRQWPPGSADYEYRTRAARKLVWIMRGVPVDQWGE